MSHSNAVGASSSVESDGREMVDYLEYLLNRQVEKLRNYDLDKAIVLAEEAAGIAENLGQSHILDQPEFYDQRGRIQRLYRQINLTVASERQEVGEKLKTIRHCLKALGAYSASGE
jgi:hypothetical protein